MLNRRYQPIINSVVEFNFIKAPKPCGNFIRLCRDLNCETIIGNARFTLCSKIVLYRRQFHIYEILCLNHLRLL